MLTPYYLTRLVCVFCGTFETGTRDRPDPAAKCVWCDEDLETIAQCRGETSRALPFTSDPRLEAEITDTSLDVINDRVSDKRLRNHANGKSTGRKRTASVEAQATNRARYRRKLNAGSSTTDIGI